MSWAFSEEGEEVVEVVAHATIDNITAARRNAVRKCFRRLLKSLIFMACLLFFTALTQYDLASRLEAL
jgi:hypothetical protein